MKKVRVFRAAGRAQAEKGVPSTCISTIARPRAPMPALCIVAQKAFLTPMSAVVPSLPP